MTETQSTRTADLSLSGDTDMQIERVFDAPREQVYRAFTDPDQISEWWGPRSTTTRVEQCELKAGGAWRFVSVNEDGSEFVFFGEFTELKEPEKVAYTFNWEGNEGQPSTDDITFIDEGERTKLVIRSTFASKDDRDAMIGAGMEKGMNESYQRLDEFLAREGAGS
jgi:uncharacterized protein YndB with AHSA1/START domain